MTPLLWKEHDTIIFDGEGVVIASEPIWTRARSSSCGAAASPDDREKLKPLLAGRSLREGAQIMQEEFGFPGDPSALAAERVAIVRDAFRRDAISSPGFASSSKRSVPASGPASRR